MEIPEWLSVGKSADSPAKRQSDTSELPDEWKPESLTTPLKKETI